MTHPHHGNRYGRSEPARQAVLRASVELLAEKGFAGVTVEGVAKAAGVAKQTIYRWWNSKTAILMDAFLERAARELTPVDHGDLAQDLRTHLRQLATFFTETDSVSIYRALMGQAQHDPALASAFRARHHDAQRARDRLPLIRAVERGELPADFDVATALDYLVGPLYYRILVTEAPVDEAFTNRLVEHFLRTLPTTL